MPLIRCLLTVTGLVQGVGFRYAAREEARRLGLNGRVRNEDDGSVTLDVEGEAKPVAQFKAWCRHGPQGARVYDVACVETPVTGRNDFQITF